MNKRKGSKGGNMSNTSNQPPRRTPHDPYTGIFWGALLTFLGTLLLLGEWGLVSEDQLWPIFISGAGLLLIGDYFLRPMVLPRSSVSVARLIFGVILTVIGLNQLYYLGDWWPLLLIFAGGAMVWSALRRKNGNVHAQHP